MKNRYIIFFKFLRINIREIKSYLINISTYYINGVQSYWLRNKRHAGISIEILSCFFENSVGEYKNIECNNQGRVIIGYIIVLIILIFTSS